MRSSRPFLVDAICFALFGALLGYIYWSAHAGNLAEQWFAALVMGLPFFLLSLPLAFSKDEEHGGMHHHR